MNRYGFMWAFINTFGAVEHRVDFVTAENETEAKKIAVLFMQFYTDSDRYTEKSIGIFWNVENVGYYTMEEMEGKRERWNKAAAKAKEKAMRGEFNYE